jgi:ABC-type sulfate transport system permease component
MRLLSLLLAFAAGAACGLLGLVIALVTAEWRRRSEGGAR